MTKPDNLRQKIDRAYGRGSYRRLRDLGYAAGLSEKELAEEIGRVAGKGLLEEYRELRRDLKVGAGFVDEAFADLLKVRMSDLMHDLLDSIDIESLDSKTKVSLLKLSVDNLVRAKDGAGEGGAGRKKLSPDQIKSRALELISAE